MDSMDTALVDHGARAALLDGCAIMRTPGEEVEAAPASSTKLPWRVRLGQS